jgi:hypothetical protein
VLQLRLPLNALLRLRDNLLLLLLPGLEFRKAGKVDVRLPGKGNLNVK